MTRASPRTTTTTTTNEGIPREASMRESACGGTRGLHEPYCVGQQHALSGVGMPGRGYVRPGGEPCVQRPVRRDVEAAQATAERRARKP
eukprot:2579855-Prymnesium_polylepis.1